MDPTWRWFSYWKWGYSIFQLRYVSLPEGILFSFLFLVLWGAIYFFGCTPFRICRVSVAPVNSQGDPVLRVFFFFFFFGGGGQKVFFVCFHEFRATPWYYSFERDTCLIPFGWWYTYKTWWNSWWSTYEKMGGWTGLPGNRLGRFGLLNLFDFHYVFKIGPNQLWMVLQPLSL